MSEVTGANHDHKNNYEWKGCQTCNPKNEELVQAVYVHGRTKRGHSVDILRPDQVKWERATYLAKVSFVWAEDFEAKVLLFMEELLLVDQSEHSKHGQRIDKMKLEVDRSLILERSPHLDIIRTLKSGVLIRMWVEAPGEGYRSYPVRIEKTK